MGHAVSKECSKVHSASYMVVSFDSAPFIAGTVYNRYDACKRRFIARGCNLKQITISLSNLDPEQ